jgi:hypothetical protein
MKYIYLIIILSIYKSCNWINFFQGMVIEIVFNNEIQIYLYFWKEKNIFVYIIEKTLKLNFNFFIWTKF